MVVGACGTLLFAYIFLVKWEVKSPAESRDEVGRGQL